MHLAIRNSKEVVARPPSGNQLLKLNGFLKLKQNSQGFAPNPNMLLWQPV